jgi:hypothetical protein
MEAEVPVSYRQHKQGDTLQNKKLWTEATANTHASCNVKTAHASHPSGRVLSILSIQLKVKALLPQATKPSGGH